MNLTVDIQCASAEPVPRMPQWPRHQCTNDEHQAALSS